MELKKMAVAGTLESSDAMVTIQPLEEGEGIDFELDSVVIHQFGEQIKSVVLDTLDRLGVNDAYVKVVDKGALDCTLKARVECAVFRASEEKTNLPWGGAIR